MSIHLCLFPTPKIWVEIDTPLEDSHRSTRKPLQNFAGKLEKVCSRFVSSVIRTAPGVVSDSEPYSGLRVVRVLVFWCLLVFFFFLDLAASWCAQDVCFSKAR